MVKKRILVVDEEPELVKAIEIRLEQTGYECGADVLITKLFQHEAAGG